MTKIKSKRFGDTDVSSQMKDTSKSEYYYAELFAGCGGLSLGLEMGGMNGTVALEIEPHAVETYRQNFHHEVINGDITEPRTKEKFAEEVRKILGDKKLDVLSGGFPCQGYSTSGFRMIDDPRNRLFKEFVEVAKILKPKVIICENVEGILSMNKGKTIKEIVTAFEEIGYNMDFRLLTAADYGVPQMRNRVIFVANRIGVANLFPAPIFPKKDYVTAEIALKDLETHEEDARFSHIFIEHSPEMVEKLRVLPQGANLYKRKDSWRRLEEGKPSPTVKDCHGACAVHYKFPRTITPREMARLQSFPDNFIFVGAKKYQYRQIGNAVPPLLAKAVGLAVRKMLDSQVFTNQVLQVEECKKNKLF